MSNSTRGGVEPSWQGSYTAPICTSPSSETSRSAQDSSISRPPEVNCPSRRCREYVKIGEEVRRLVENRRGVQGTTPVGTGAELRCQQSPRGTCRKQGAGVVVRRPESEDTRILRLGFVDDLSWPTTGRRVEARSGESRMPGLRGHLSLDPHPFLQLICTLSENTDHICMYTYRSEKVRNLILTSVADRQEMGNGRLEPGRDATIKVDEVPRSDSVQHSI